MARTKRLAIGFLDSVAALWARWAKHTSRAAKKLRPEPTRVSPRHFLTAISSKASRFRGKKKGNDVVSGGGEELEDDEEYGLWQRSILMGDKCEPLDFSGVILYDTNGKQLPVR